MNGLEHNSRFVEFLFTSLFTIPITIEKKVEKVQLTNVSVKYKYTNSINQIFTNSD